MKQEIKQFDLERLRGKAVAVNCKTEEQAQDFVNWVYSLGVDECNRPFWENYKENSCYILTKNSIWSFESIEYYETLKYKVISYEEALLKPYKPIIRDEFIKKVKTEKIGIICNSQEEYDICYDFFDKHMDKSLKRKDKTLWFKNNEKDAFGERDIIMAHFTDWGYNHEWNLYDYFLIRKGFTIYNFKDIIEESENYMVYVKGKGQPKVRHTYENAVKEAKRLSAKEIGKEVNVVKVLKTFKSEVIVNEVT